MLPLEKMFEGLTSKINVLDHALDLSGALKSEDYVKLAHNVGREMNSISKELHFLKIQIQNEKEKLWQQQELKLQWELFKEHVLYTSSNLPAKLPQLSKPKKVEPKKEDEREQGLSAKTSCLTVCEYLRLLTTEQFESVPKYIKGRLPYDKANAIIEKLNGVFVEKYKILKLKRKTLSDVNRKKCEAFKSQENKDTKGVHFIVDRDIEDSSTLKMDNTLRSILTMLRHCGMMHEIRGGGFVRYACFSY